MKFIKGNIAYVCLLGLIAIQLCFTFVAGAEVTQCVQCGGSSQEACGTNVNALNLADCPETLKDAQKCFTKIENGVVSRGCLPLNDAACTAENKCAVTEPKLNKQLVCKTCATTDADCSQTDMNNNATNYIQICEAGQSQCRINVNDKSVERGCATAEQVTACTDAVTCKHCDSVLCNTGIFPEKRINCFQCSESTCADVSANSIPAKPCRYFVANDQCYTKGESATTMKRGCQSDVSTDVNNPNQCSATKDGCVFCSTDNCNNLKYQRDPTRKCYQCTGNATETECFKQQTSTEFKNCEKQVLYNDTEYCYIQAEGGKIQRGCLNDNTELTVANCKDDAICTKCTEPDGCNSKAVSNEFTCIQCRSDENKKCWNEANSLTGSKCRTCESSASEGCFHGIWNGVAIRGCYCDADERQQYVCKDANNNQCHLCHNKDCNIEKSSSGAATIQMYFGLWLMILTTVWYFK